MSASPEFRLEFRIEYDEYAEATLHSPSGSRTFKCIDHTDGLGMLADRLGWMLDLPTAQGVVKWEMQGQTWWVLDRRGQRIDVNLVDFQETQEHLPGGHYITVYRFRSCEYFVSVRFEKFVAEVVRSFGVLESLGFDTDYSAWGYDYPIEAVAKLRRFLSAE